jgi:hypothetical protein
VGLATLVPVTGAWVAVGDVSVHLSGPSTSHSIAGSSLPAGSPDRARPTASATLVLSRSPSPSLDAVSRSAMRTPAHEGRTTPRVTVPLSPGTQPSARHRADQAPEAAPTPAVAGRHRADNEDRSTAPHREGDEQGRQTSPGHADDSTGTGGSDGQGNSRHGGSNGNGRGYGRDGSGGDSQDDTDAAGGSESSQDEGSQDERSRDSSSSGQRNGHASGDSQGRPEPQGNAGQGRSQGHGG